MSVILGKAARVELDFSTLLGRKPDALRDATSDSYNVSQWDSKPAGLFGKSPRHLNHGFFRVKDSVSLIFFWTRPIIIVL